jgi:hypothetical protein
LRITIKTFLTLIAPLAAATLAHRFGGSTHAIRWTALVTAWAVLAWVMQSEVLSRIVPLSRFDRTVFYSIEHSLLLVLGGIAAAALLG